MSPERRTALVSVVAAAGLIALKLATGLATGSLGLISEAAHSGTDLVAALLTFFAVGVAKRPADVGHPYGHGRAEHLSALGEAAILVVVALAIVWRALLRLAGETEGTVDPTWYAFVVVGVVIAVDLSRTFVSARAARRYGSAALQANALHFGSDMAGSAAVLIGLVVARSGYENADSLAALFVAVLVLTAAGRLMAQNVNVLMDHVPTAAEATARDAIGRLRPPVELRRLRMRQAGARHFADVVIGVPPGAAVGQGHAAADAVEEAVQRALPETDVVVHVEPADVDADLRERVHAAVFAVPRVREVHNVRVLHVGGRSQLSLHVKLPGDLPLEEAHLAAEEVEGEIVRRVPEVDGVLVHLEPLSEGGAGSEARDAADEKATIERLVFEETGTRPKELRFLRTEDGLIVFLTLTLDREMPLWMAHTQASEVEERIRGMTQGIADVVVHTEP